MSQQLQKKQFIKDCQKKPATNKLERSNTDSFVSEEVKKLLEQDFDESDNQNDSGEHTTKSKQNSTRKMSTSTPKIKNSTEHYYFASISSLDEESEEDIDERDVSLIQQQINCSKTTAIRQLRRNNYSEYSIIFHFRMANSRIR